MNTLLMIAFRNLFRQKRRNVLLGAAIAIGTLVLVMANSFSHGISRTLIDRVVSYVAGHASVSFAHEGKMMSQVMRGGAHWRESIEKIPHVKKVEPTMGVMGRAIGNGRSDNIILIAINMHTTFSSEDSAQNEDNFTMLDGSWAALKDSTIENPLIISAAKAKYLNVKLGDVVRIRIQDFDGRIQAERLTVAGIFTPSNIFMEGALFIELKDMSRIMGVRSYDSPILYLTLEDPAKNAVGVADSIWKLMAPPLAYMDGRVALGSDTTHLSNALLSGFHADSISLIKLKAKIGLIEADTNLAFKRKGALVPRLLADSLHCKIGDTLRFRYALRFPDSLTGPTSVFKVIVGGLYTPPDSLPSNLILMHEVTFYDKFYESLPKASLALKLDSASYWFKALTTEWARLPRAHTTDEFSKHQREISQGKYKATAVTVNTMYEAASQILKLESALQIITLSAVMVIFLIILIGVINTLRMTIRERTREIGTLRALGMQKEDIRMVFLMETGLLAFFAAVAGTILSFVVMWGLSLITIASAGNPLGIILVRGHLVFAPTAISVLFFNALIVVIAIATAWFPSNRAAKLPAATAMRHYE